MIKVQLPSTRRAYARVTPRVPTEYQAQRCGDAGFQYQARLCRKQRYQAMYHTEPTPGVSPRDPNMWSTGSERMRKNHVTRMQCIHIKSRTHVRNCQAQISKTNTQMEKAFRPPSQAVGHHQCDAAWGLSQTTCKKVHEQAHGQRKTVGAVSPSAVLHRPHTSARLNDGVPKNKLKSIRIRSSRVR